MPTSAHPGADSATEPGRSDPVTRPMGIRQALREIRKGVVVMWWGFFDWLAVVSWKTLLLVSFLGLIIGGGILKLPTLACSAHRRRRSSSRSWRAASAGRS